MNISWEERKAATAKLIEEAVAFSAVSEADLRDDRHGIYVLVYQGRDFGSSPWEEPQPHVVYLGHIGADSQRHWDNRTGYSTLRRSLAAMLAGRLDLHAVARSTDPADEDRFANYALDEESEARLSQWMNENLRCAFLELPPEQVEAWFDALMDYNTPIFVFQHNPNNNYGAQIKLYRSKLIEEAELSVAQ